LLPCNINVQQSSGDSVEVAAIDPLAAMQAIANRSLIKSAEVVRSRLVIDLGSVRHCLKFFISLFEASFCENLAILDQDTTRTACCDILVVGAD